VLAAPLDPRLPFFTLHLREETLARAANDILAIRLDGWDAAGGRPRGA
jgi:hypothetical protein